MEQVSSWGEGIPSWAPALRQHDKSLISSPSFKLGCHCGCLSEAPLFLAVWPPAVSGEMLAAILPLTRSPGSTLGAVFKCHICFLNYDLSALPPLEGLFGHVPEQVCRWVGVFTR